jgi:hypothetical protein
LTQLPFKVSNCKKALIELIGVKKMMSDKSMKISNINAQLQRNPIVIIGMASIFPQARNLKDYWENIICHDSDGNN